jgi:hypothetical protein
MSRTDDTGHYIITRSQQVAAKWAGGILLLAMTTALVAELILLNGIVVSSDPARTVTNLVEAQARYRLGHLVHMLTFASDAAVAAAMYVVLRPVSRGLVMTGALLRAANCAVLIVSVAVGLTIMRIAKSPEYLSAFAPEQIQGLARLFYGVQSDVMSTGWVLLGLGQAVFALAWLRSRYVPRVLAAWGVFASLLLATGPIVNMLAPGSAPLMAFMVPMFFYEVPLGLWLLTRGLRERT